MIFPISFNICCLDRYYDTKAAGMYWDNESALYAEMMTEEHFICKTGTIREQALLAGHANPSLNKRKITYAWIEVTYPPKVMM